MAHTARKSAAVHRIQEDIRYAEAAAAGRRRVLAAIEGPLAETAPDRLGDVTVADTAAAEAAASILRTLKWSIRDAEGTVVEATEALARLTGATP